jgi:DNA mismatch repair protein MutL
LTGYLPLENCWAVILWRLFGTGEDREKNWKKKLYAMASCKAAVKDGERLDRSTAEKLIGQAFLLPFPRCPHGRPLWFEISKDELFQLVGRIV